MGERSVRHPRSLVTERTQLNGRKKAAWDRYQMWSFNSELLEMRAFYRKRMSNAIIGNTFLGWKNECFREGKKSEKKFRRIQCSNLGEYGMKKAPTSFAAAGFLKVACFLGSLLSPRPRRLMEAVNYTISWARWDRARRNTEKKDLGPELFKPFFSSHCVDIECMINLYNHIVCINVGKCASETEHVTWIRHISTVCCMKKR